MLMCAREPHELLEEQFFVPYTSGKDGNFVPVVAGSNLEHVCAILVKTRNPNVTASLAHVDTSCDPKRSHVFKELKMTTDDKALVKLQSLIWSTLSTDGVIDIHPLVLRLMRASSLKTFDYLPSLKIEWIYLRPVWSSSRSELKWEAVDFESVNVK